MLLLITLCLAQTPSISPSPTTEYAVAGLEDPPPTVAEPPSVPAPVGGLDDATILEWGRNFGNSLLAIGGLLGLWLVKLVATPPKEAPVRQQKRPEYSWDEPGMGAKTLQKSRAPARRAAR